MDSSGNTGLWVTNGTAAGSFEIKAGTQGAYSLIPAGDAQLGTKVLFAGTDSSGARGLWVTDGTGAGTIEICRAPRAGQSFAGDYFRGRIAGDIRRNRFQRQYWALGHGRHRGRHERNRRRHAGFEEPYAGFYHPSPIGVELDILRVNSSGNRGFGRRMARRPGRARSSRVRRARRISFPAVSSPSMAKSCSRGRTHPARSGFGSPTEPPPERPRSKPARKGQVRWTPTVLSPLAVRCTSTARTLRGTRVCGPPTGLQPAPRRLWPARRASIP